MTHRLWDCRNWQPYYVSQKPPPPVESHKILPDARPVPQDTGIPRVQAEWGVVYRRDGESAETFIPNEPDWVIYVVVLRLSVCRFCGCLGRRGDPEQARGCR
jgi:hypothetical protein